VSDDGEQPAPDMSHPNTNSPISLGTAALLQRVRNEAAAAAQREASKPSGRCHLLSLAAETRKMIWDFVSRESEPGWAVQMKETWCVKDLDRQMEHQHITQTADIGKPAGAPDLANVMGTCRELASEIKPVLYGLLELRYDTDMLQCVRTKPRHFDCPSMKRAPIQDLAALKEVRVHVQALETVTGATRLAFTMQRLHQEQIPRKLTVVFVGCVGTQTAILPKVLGMWRWDGGHVSCSIPSYVDGRRTVSALAVAGVGG